MIKLSVIRYVRKFEAWSESTSIYAAGSVNLVATRGYLSDTLQIDGCKPGR